MHPSALTRYLLHAPRPVKQLLAVVSDVLMCALVTVLAMDIRTEAVLPWTMAHDWMLLFGVLIAVPVFTAFGLYRAIFRYAGVKVLYALSKALFIYGVAYGFIFTVLGVGGVPKSMGLLQPMMFSLGVMASRLLVRRWLGGGDISRAGKGVPRVLIYGAGAAGRQLATGLGQSSELRVVGYVDDDTKLHGHVLNGLTIFDPATLEQVVTRLRVGHIYLALPSASRRRRDEIIQSLLPLRLQVRILPGLLDLTNGRVEVSDLKDLDIEDLLGRDPVTPNPLMIAKNIAGKVVLVTGAGGSIGSELCRQILKSRPLQLLLVELSEYALYAIEQELRQLLANKNEQTIEIIPLLADVRSTPRMAEIMRTWHPHTVYHAAAYKHVPLVEHNPAEGVRNNVLGTWVTAKQAAEYGVSDFVFVSTDKAVRPTNIMGASKRLAEMVLQAMAERGHSGDKPGVKMRLSMVRFGNVLGSSGSVVPLFKKQIQQGGPITLTDPRITRYFMTIPEAAQLVIQAGAMANGGEVFVLDMGESVKIIDLARKMVELSGLTMQDEDNPDGDIAIEITGLRPGEKLYEELLIGENPLPTQHPRIMKAHENFLSWSALQHQLNELMNAADANDVYAIRSWIKAMVPGYRPDVDVMDWVWLKQEKSAA